MSWLLNLIYALLVLAVSPWLGWQAWRTGKYRQGFSAKLLGAAPRREGDSPCIWFHAVSVGEVNLLATLLRAAREHRPDVVCFISTTTRTGYELAKKKYPQHTVFYAPLDFSWAVARALDRVRPSCLVLAELELWPNWIAAARRRNIPVTVVNGRLSDRSFRRYHRVRWCTRRMLSQLHCIAAQNDEYAERFRALGAEPAQVCVTGSVKFDGARTDRRNVDTARLSRLAGIATDDIVLLAGSTQAPEEMAALAAFQSLAPQHPALRLILVPRHPERFDEVAGLLSASGVAWQRRSTLDLDGAIAGCRVLLVDTIGELGAWWGSAHIGFVGGSLSQRGGQNMIEPAAYGAAVCFGPNTQNFRDVVALLQSQDAALTVADAAELAQFVRRCLEEATYRESLGRRAQQLVQQQLGATERTWAVLAPLLASTSASLQTSRAA